MSRRKTGIKLALAIAALCSFSPGAAKGWEMVKADKVHAHHVASEQEFEIRAGGGMIFVTCSKSLNIKIFSILGSRIADDTLQPGTYQFAVPTHGVYIIKTGDLTCKVAV